MLSELAKYEKAIGMKQLKIDEDTEFEFHHMQEVQDLRIKQLRSIFKKIEDFEMLVCDNIFSLISATHKFSTLLQDKFNLLKCRKEAFKIYINDLNLALID